MMNIHHMSLNTINANVALKDVCVFVCRLFRDGFAAPHEIREQKWSRKKNTLFSILLPICCLV